GQCLWSQVIGGPGADGVHAVATDASGNMVACGVSGGTIQLGGGMLPSNGGQDGFVAKYSSTGTYQWAQDLGGAGPSDSCNAVTVDGTGSVVVTGTFQQTVNFGSVTLTSQGGVGTNGFLAKYSSAGANVWAKSFGPGANSPYAVAVDQGGNVAVAGGFQTMVSFGGPTHTSGGVLDVFVAKYTPAGAYLWSRAFGGLWSDWALGVGMDGSGNVGVTGGFTAGAYFDVAV